MSWRRTRPGLAIGPSRLNTVGMPISRRDGAAKRKAGWKRGAKQKPMPASATHCGDAVRRQLDVDTQRFEHVSGATLRRGGAGSVLAHGGSGAGRDERRHGRHVDRVRPVASRADDVDCRRSRLVRERDERGVLQHGVEQAGDLLGRLTFGAKGDDETDQLCRRGVAVEDRAHRCTRLLGGEVDAVEQGGEERGPSAVLFEMYHAVNLSAPREGEALAIRVG